MINLTRLLVLALGSLSLTITATAQIVPPLTPGTGGTVDTLPPPTAHTPSQTARSLNDETDLFSEGEGFDDRDSLGGIEAADELSPEELRSPASELPPASNGLRSSDEMLLPPSQLPGLNQFPGSSSATVPFPAQSGGVVPNPPNTAPGAATPGTNIPGGTPGMVGPMTTSPGSLGR